MAMLTSLPNELIRMICDELYPYSDKNVYISVRRDCLEELALFAQTNRRLRAIVEPILYATAARFHALLPLGWAAKRGYAATLRKALAAGTDPDTPFRFQLPRRILRRAHEARQAAMRWADQAPEYWPPPDPNPEDTARSRPRRGALSGRQTPPSPTDLDVFLPGTQHVVADPQRYFQSNYLPEADGSHEPLPIELETGDYVMRAHTALHLAATEGHADIIDTLLDHGASINSPSRWFCSCQPPRGLWQTLLDSGTGGLSAQLWNWSPLHVAICSSRIDTAKHLVSRGAKITWDFREPSALHQAAAAGYADLVEHILATHPGLDIDQQDPAGLTPFYHAYANGRWDSTVPLLLARGANINFRLRVRHRDDSLVVTPLSEACRLGRFEDALKLIDLGADVTVGIEDVNVTIGIEDDVSDWDEHEPIQDDVSDWDEPEPIRAHMPLLHVCCMDVAGSDLERFPEAETVWLPAETQSGYRAKVITRLIDAGASPNAKWNRGGGGGWYSREETPLSIAARHANTDAIKALLCAGADVKACNLQKRNALMAAVQKPAHTIADHNLHYGSWGSVPRQYMGLPNPRDYPDRWTVVKMLLDAGTPVNDRDADGNTPLHLLFKGRSYMSGWMDFRAERRVLSLLLARGADPCLPNSAGVSALQVAARKGFLHAVEAIASKCRIDLVERFTMKEIVGIFDAVHPDECRSFHAEQRRVLGDASSSDSDSESDYPTPPVNIASFRLFGALVDMDLTGRLSSDAAFICSQLAGPRRGGMSLELGEILCSRGLELGSFDPDTKLMLLRAAVKAGCWSLARVLLRELPTTMDIDALDSDGRTLLSLATMSPPGGAGFVMQLIEAGADIHRTVSLTITAGTGYADGENTTPLKQALMRPTVFPIKQMLRKQPIAGNSQAMGHRYLHWAVTMPWRLGVPYTRRSVPSEARGSAIRLLLAAGADPSQVDDNGDTALSAFLRELECSDPELIREIFHWVRPLARGVDVNRKNKQGSTAADYLLMLLETEDDDLADFLDCQFRFRPLGNGRPRDVEILWGVKEY